MLRTFIAKISQSEKWQSVSAHKGKLFLSLIIAILAAAALVWLFDKLVVYLYARSYVDELSTQLDLNKNLATALVWIVFAISTVFIGLTISFSKTQRRIGLLGLLALFVAQPFVLFLADRPFDRKGVAQKCYIVLRDSIKYGENTGIDPKTGLECKALTPDIAERVERYANGNRPKRIDTTDPTFFDLRTGRPIVWFAKNKSQTIEIFDLMGFHPDTGEELSPISKDIVEVWRDQNRKAPERIYPDENFAFFDPVTGRPTAWYLKPAGDYVFYNRPGFDPRTGEPLLVVDAGAIAEWKKYTSENTKQCYVLTKNSVRYLTKLGIDPVTGQQCRPFSAEMLLRLREYENGNRPKRVEVAEPVFFDLRSGEPSLWFAKSGNGKIELFSLMGFHPDTGEELLPITKEMAALWKDQQAKRTSRIPQKIDPANYVFFDQITGDPRAWYWRGPDGLYEFYDGPGFHPRTGDSLTVLTKVLVVQFQEEAKQKTVRDAQAQKEKEDADRNRRIAKEKVSNSERMCDELAANPNDKNRVGDGVPYDSLNARKKEAIEACEIASNENPNTQRLQYQLARVLQLSDRNRAYSILQKLVNQNYPAAFDNLGWMAYTDKKNPAQATALFRAGVQLNDTDSMISLAEMVDRGHAQPQSPSETKLQLYRHAAQLGNLTGKKAAEVEQQKANVSEISQAQQLRQQQIALEMFGQIIQSMPRR